MISPWLMTRPYLNHNLLKEEIIMPSSSLFQQLRLLAINLLIVFTVLSLNPISIAQAKKKVIAVLDFDNRAKLKPDDVDYICGLVREKAAELLSGRPFSIMTKDNMMAMLPKDADLGECTGAECEVAAGRMIGADIIISGEVTRFGKKFKVVIKMHETHSAEFLGSKRGEAVTVGNLERPVQKAAEQLLRVLLGQSPATSPTPGATSAKIGTGKVEGGVSIDMGEKIVNQITDDSGFLVIKSHPKKANIFINGKEVGKTPLQLEKMVGQYIIVAKLGKLYHPSRQDLNLTTEGARLTMELQPAFGSVEITSLPSGADIWLNEEKVGETPYQAERKLSGTYNLRLSQDYYFEHSGQITIKDGRLTKKQITLQQNYGGLEITSQPDGAAISLNQEPTEFQTPYTYDKLQPGLYVVGLKLDGYGEAIEKVTVKNKQSAKLDVKLEPKYGQLSVMSSYEDGTLCEGKIYVDGEEQGLTPKKLKLTATRHEIRVVCEKGEKKEEVTIEHNKKRRLKVEISTGPDVPEGAVHIPADKLMWQKGRASSEMKWSSAKSYCSNLSLGGYSDWRLPTKAEYMDLLGGCPSGASRDGSGSDFNCSKCSSSSKCNSMFPGDTNWYWSSTTHAYYSYGAWRVYFNDGYVDTYDKDHNGSVRCLRP